MPYDGLKDPTKRADLIAYLQTLKNNRAAESLPKRPSQEDNMSSIRRFASRRQVLGGGLALATLPAPFVRAHAAEPIRIGFPIPLTGPYQQEALDMLRGATSPSRCSTNRPGSADRRGASDPRR